MELRQLRYFVAVAEEENFRRASERLSIAQPALSRQIAMLEAELGVELFTRSKRRIHLSTTGQFYLQDVTRVLADLRLVNERVKQVSAGTVGLLRLAFHETAGRSPLVTGAPRYRNVELRLIQMTSQQQVEPLRARSIEAGLLYLTSVDATGFDSIKISTDRFYLTVNRNHRLAKGNYTLDLAT